MGIPKKTIAVVLLLLVVHFCFPTLLIALADQLPAAKAKVTEHEPSGRMTAEIDSTKTSGGKWLWALLGVAVIGGVAAAAGGGGGGGGGGETTGSVSGSW
jgi:hypothetical protein